MAVVALRGPGLFSLARPIIQEAARLGLTRRATETSLRSILGAAPRSSVVSQVLTEFKTHISLAEEVRRFAPSTQIRTFHLTKTASQELKTPYLADVRLTYISTEGVLSQTSLSFGYARLPTVGQLKAEAYNAVMADPAHYDVKEIISAAFTGGWIRATEAFALEE